MGFREQNEHTHGCSPLKREHTTSTRDTTPLDTPTCKRQKSRGGSEMASLAKQAHFTAEVVEQDTARSKLITLKEQVRRLKYDFDQYDRDGSGLIDAAELSAAVCKGQKELRRNIRLNYATDTARSASRELSGQSSLSMELFRVVGKGKDAATDLKDTIFWALDANEDGEISFSEVLRVVYKRATPRELEEMIGWTGARVVTPAHCFSAGACWGAPRR